MRSSPRSSLPADSMSAAGCTPRAAIYLRSRSVPPGRQSSRSPAAANSETHRRASAPRRSVGKHCSLERACVAPLTIAASIASAGCSNAGASESQLSQASKKFGAIFRMHNATPISQKIRRTLIDTRRARDRVPPPRATIFVRETRMRFAQMASHRAFG